MYPPQYMAEAWEGTWEQSYLVALMPCSFLLWTPAKRLYCCPPFALQAFFEGKLKVTGNTALALKLQTIIPRPGKAKL